MLDWLGTRRCLFVATCCAIIGSFAPSAAQGPAPRALRVAAPAGAAADLIGQLALIFQAQTGQAVNVVPQQTPDLIRSAQGNLAVSDAMLLPHRIELGQSPRTVARAIVFTSEAILVGSRTDKARVRGQRDIRKVFRWVAGARALTTASSSQLGLRSLELQLWDVAGVDIRSRTSWYETGEGDEAAAFVRAAASGSYVLIEHMTFAAQRDRRGLETITGGDPLLVTRWESLLLSPEPAARAWHEWLQSEAGRDAIGQAQINGVAPLTPASPETARPADPSRRGLDPS